MILNNLTFNGIPGAVINEAGFTTRGEVLQPVYDTPAGSPMSPSMFMDFSGANYNSSIVRNDTGRKELYFSFDYFFEPLTANWTRNIKPFMFFEEASAYSRMCYIAFQDRTGELVVETYYGGGPSNPAGTLYSSNFGPAITLEMLANKRVTFKVGIRIPTDMTQPGRWRTNMVIDGVERVAIDGPVMFGAADLGIQWYGSYCSTEWMELVNGVYVFHPGVISRARLTNLVIADAEADIFAPPVVAPTSIPVSTALATNRMCLATDYLRRLQGLKNNCSAWNSVLSGSVLSDQIIVIAHQLGMVRTTFNAYLTPVQISYLTAELGIDPTVTMQAINTEIGNVIAWTRSTIPSDTGGYLLERRVDINGNVTTMTLTPAQTASCRTALSNIIALIG